MCADLGVMQCLTPHGWDAGEERKLEVRGLFYGIGHTPNSRLIEGQVELDDKGYVKVSAYPGISAISLLTFRV